MEVKKNAWIQQILLTKLPVKIWEEIAFSGKTRICPVNHGEKSGKEFPSGIKCQSRRLLSNIQALAQLRYGIEQLLGCERLV